jgi:hypothetical protein
MYPIDYFRWDIAIYEVNFKRFKNNYANIMVKLVL